MATAREVREESRSKAYMDAYARLTNVLTNMYATERRALDDSVLYSEAMELVIAGRDSEAVALASQFRDFHGDVWRKKAAAYGLIPTDSFVNEV